MAAGVIVFFVEIVFVRQFIVGKKALSNWLSAMRMEKVCCRFR